MVIDRQMIKDASGGALVDKTPVAASQLIEIMASNNQQFHTRSNSTIPVCGVHEMTTRYAVDNAQMKEQLDNHTSMMKQLIIPQTVAKVCGICTANHAIDTCPTLQEVEGENNVECPQAYAANIFNSGRQCTDFSFIDRLSNPPQQPFNHDFSTNKYNSGWRNHPNLRWGNSQQQQQPSSLLVVVLTKDGYSLEDIMKQMIEFNMKFHQKANEIVQKNR